MRRKSRHVPIRSVINCWFTYISILSLPLSSCTSLWAISFFSGKEESLFAMLSEILPGMFIRVELRDPFEKMGLDGWHVVCGWSGEAQWCRCSCRCRSGSGRSCMMMHGQDWWQFWAGRQAQAWGGGGRGTR